MTSICTQTFFSSIHFIFTKKKLKLLFYTIYLLHITKMDFPIIDGHFWVERDGKIIDPHFPSYNMICKLRKCDSKAPKSYIPAPEITQTLIKDMFMKILKNVLGEKSQEEIFSEFMVLTKLYIGLKPVVNRCFQNCIIEIAERGGTLVFGSMGFKYKNKDGYFYEFGGENYTTVKQFIK